MLGLPYAKQWLYVNVPSLGPRAQAGRKGLEEALLCEFRYHFLVANATNTFKETPDFSIPGTKFFSVSGPTYFTIVYPHCPQWSSCRSTVGPTKNCVFFVSSLSLFLSSCTSETCVCHGIPRAAPLMVRGPSP